MHHRQLRFLGPSVAALGALLLAGACGGDGGGGASATPVQGRVTITPETATTPFVLAKGTYRISWSTTDCAGVTVAITGDTGFTKEKSSKIQTFSWILTSVPDGTYTAQQTDQACAAWELTVERVGGG